MNYIELVESSIAYHQLLLDDRFENDFKEVLRVLMDTFASGNKLLIAGNGGSAADAQHFAAELVGRFLLERKGIPAIALTTDSSILTSLSNDYEFNKVFSRQVEALAVREDALFVISTSGKSMNLVEAVKKAKTMGVITIGLLGKDGGILGELCDYSLIISGNDTPRIQEIHILIIHMLCQLIEEGLFANV